MKTERESCTLCVLAVEFLREAPDAGESGNNELDTAIHGNAT